MASVSSPSATNHVEQLLDEVRSRIQVDKKVLKEARTRRDRIKSIAEDFEGARQSFDSGSIAHATAHDPLGDADSGIVIDRRSRPELGPDGLGIGPIGIVNDMAAYVFPTLKAEYPNATCQLLKRAILFELHEPIDDEDPTVDLIVGLTRVDEPGLWIPNRATDTWDASHPERHTELMTAEPKPLRVHRARIVRLAKVAVKQDDPRVLISSFNLTALALEVVTGVEPLAIGLQRFFAEASASLALTNTADPAGVSDPIKLPDGVSRQETVQRLSQFATWMDEALENKDDEVLVRAALSRVFPEQVDAIVASKRDDLASALKNNRKSELSAAFGTGAGALKTTSAFGDHDKAA